MGKKYSKEFKLEALALAEQVGGAQAARSLGIQSNLLYRWRQERKEAGDEAFRGHGNMTAQEAELARLRRENANLKEDREILKKSLRDLLPEEPQVRMEWISAHSKQFKIQRMTELLNVSRSGYYSHVKRVPSKRAQENSFLQALVKEIYVQGRKCYGSPHVTASLRQQGYLVGRNRVARLMQENHLNAKMKRKRVNTTDSRHTHPIAENILNRQFQVPAMNQVWTGDITYIPTREGWLYLAVVLDLHSRKVVGWSMSPSMATELVTNAMQMAVQRRCTQPGLLFHSDRGSQYASQAFQAYLRDTKMIPSMSRKSNCYDNACSESFFGTLKLECCDRVFISRKEASSAIFEYIEVFYNRQRLHSSLGYLSPEQFEQRNVA